MDAIVDTGYLVALVRQHDQHHTWANGLAGRLSLPLLTCEAVLAEAAFHLKSSLYIFAMLRRGALRLAFDIHTQLEPLHNLAKRYEDRGPDLADLCLIRMSELYPRHTVITVDEEDFRVYRRNKREVIPLLCPPKK
jgi:predicted nucleic acid-binding protein